MSTSNAFIPEEAQNLVALCANINGAVQPVPPNLTPPPEVTQPEIPPNWICLYNQDLSHKFGIFKNTWQLWQNPEKNQYAVVFQGTESYNALEDILLPLLQIKISAQGNILGSEYSFNLSFPETSGAGAHAGFTYATLVMFLDVLYQLHSANPQKGSTVFITGHSMGAAIATCMTSMLSTFLARAKSLPYPLSLLFKWLDNISDWKTYVFAQPKPGNEVYSNEIDFIFSNNGAFYRTTQTLDWVPQVPLTLECLTDINTPNPISTTIDPWLAKLLPSAEDIVKFLELKWNDLIKDIDRYLNQDLKLALSQLAAAEEQNLNARFPYISSEINTLLDSVQASVDLVYSLNFASSGTPIILQGNAAAPLNPQNPKDFMWQHHAAQYYWLLSQYYNLPTHPAQQASN